MEKHHIIPLAIWWTSVQENIASLESWTHKVVHQILNIPYRKIREYREEINWKILISEKWLELEKDMQLQYFSKAKKLDKHIFKQHYNSIVTQSGQIPLDKITYNVGQNQIEEAIYNMYKNKIKELIEINNKLWKYE